MTKPDLGGQRLLDCRDEPVPLHPITLAGDEQGVDVVVHMVQKGELYILMFHNPRLVLLRQRLLPALFLGER